MTPLDTVKCEPDRASSACAGTVSSIGIAGLKLVSAPDRIRTVLGSCIGIAMYDRVAKIGGLAHIILPSSKEGSGDPRKFADTAVDILLEELIAAGSERKRIAAKIAGGAAMFGPVCAGGLGDRNSEAVRSRLKHYSIRLAGEAVGGTKGRKMLLDPATGKVQVEVIGEVMQLI